MERFLRGPHARTPTRRALGFGSVELAPSAEPLFHGTWKLADIAVTK
jgi:hypothetical protein